MDTSFTLIFLLLFRSPGLVWSLVPCVDYYVVYLRFSIDSKRPETAAKSNILRNGELFFYLFLHWFPSFALYLGTSGIDCPLYFSLAIPNTTQELNTRQKEQRFATAMIGDRLSTQINITRSPATTAYRKPSSSSAT